MSIALAHQTFAKTVSGGSATKTITIPTPAAGNTLVLMSQAVGGQTIVSVSGGGVTWSNVAVLTQLSGASGEIWIGANSSGSGTTISVTVSATYSNFDVSISEWSGMPATLTADGGSQASTANPTNVTPSVTPTAGKAVLLLATIVSYTGTETAGPSGGFTALDTTGGTGYAYFAYQVVASASGNYQCGWTASRSYSSAPAGLYAFDGSSGGASRPLFRQPLLNGLGAGGSFFNNPVS